MQNNFLFILSNTIIKYGIHLEQSEIFNPKS